MSLVLVDSSAWIDYFRGRNSIDILHLIIMQNALQNDLAVYSTDRHFTRLKQFHKFRMF